MRKFLIPIAYISDPEEDMAIHSMKVEIVDSKDALDARLELLRKLSNEQLELPPDEQSNIYYLENLQYGDEGIVIGEPQEITVTVKVYQSNES